MYYPEQTPLWNYPYLHRQVPTDGQGSVWDRVNRISKAIGNAEFVRSACPHTLHSHNFKHLMDFSSQLGTRAAAVT